jgi:hypothetical protein
LNYATTSYLLLHFQQRNQERNYSQRLSTATNEQPAENHFFLADISEHQATTPPPQDDSTNSMVMKIVVKPQDSDRSANQHKLGSQRRNEHSMNNQSIPDMN